MDEAAAVAGDLALLERAASGEPQAFEALVLRYQDRVYGLALRLTRSPEEAEDVTQDAFLKAYRALASFRGGSSFYTWLFRIAFNAAQSRLRSLGRLHAREKPTAAAERPEEDDPPEVAEPASQDPGPADLAEQRDSVARVERAIEELEPGHRAVVVLRDVEGLSYGEIAEVTGSTRAAVKSRLHRARGELARKLEDLLP
jgi:RNA polymerase sigma-70 factor (ECF subfamily)